MKEFYPILPFRFILFRELELSSSDFDQEGRLIIKHPYFARLISFQIQRNYNKNIFPGKLNSLAILDALFDFIMNKFDSDLSRNSIKFAFDFLKNKLSQYDFEILIKIYLENFLTWEILNTQLSIEELLIRNLESLELKSLFIRNIILIYLSNQNIAVTDLKILFDDVDLNEKSNYQTAITEIKNYFHDIRLIQFKNKSLIEFLLEPIQASPENIEGQLIYIKENWVGLIPDEIFNQIPKAIDLLKEDAKIFQVGFGRPETRVPTFSLEEILGFGDKFKNFYPITPPELEKFTPDTDWMPKVVLIAKNIYVWLYQLSKKYNREINKLDQIPDEELDLLSSYGFNALWLIGIWERSSASRKIKQLAGNPEALASAYSIYDYIIANDLGGEESYRNLNERCWRRGIRLACDIVPNHMGIYSRWLIEHPDYFIQTDYSPFPSYSFTGPNLSENPDFQIRIEDKYWTRQDAAVVFQLIDNRTGRIRYIYHGNDGTNMPWNDTAQLNLLKTEVREELIKLIFEIAKKFPIIRLDAAMTLTQKHYQRLWFPLPGTGGAIPSRTDFAMSTDEFLQHYPKEFWREVIDRISIEKSDTLLLAEAFWLMEGYFVRTLGMHRVYNSAFMNMLKNEENAKYRDLITNTLEFNPEILKRYVNFLSNPDEETAINQFGDGDKYFGCAVMMVTLPGLPMFAHGQIEGLREKYGHEFAKPYYDEIHNDYLLERHKREIFPLMKKRYLFSQVENFEFFDFKNTQNEIIEDIFAYSNRAGDERALVFYNNSYNTYYGFIEVSCPKNYGSSEKESDKVLMSKSLGDALGIKNSDKSFYLFKESKTNLEFLIKGSDFFNKKFFIELKGYEYKVFIDFIELYDNSGELEEFYQSYGNTGFISINQELLRFGIKKLITKLKSELSIARFMDLLKVSNNHENFVKELTNLINRTLGTININSSKFEFEIQRFFRTLNLLNTNISRLLKRKSKPRWLVEFFNRLTSANSLENLFYQNFVATILTEIIKFSSIESPKKEILFDEFLKLFSEELWNLDDIYMLMAIIEELEISALKFVNNQLELNDEEINLILINLLNKDSIQKFLEVNEYQAEIYYRKEKFDVLLELLSLTYLFWISKNVILSDYKPKLIDFQKIIRTLNIFIKKYQDISKKTGYKFYYILRKNQDNFET